MPETDLITDLESVLERLKAKHPKEPKTILEAGPKAREFLRAGREQASEKSDDKEDSSKDARDEARAQ